jgi:hypothetical protein
MSAFRWVAAGHAIELLISPHHLGDFPANRACLYLIKVIS